MVEEGGLRGGGWAEGVREGGECWRGKNLRVRIRSTDACRKLGCAHHRIKGKKVKEIELPSIR